MKTKIICFILLALTIQSYAIINSGLSDPVKKVVQELNVRGGLPNFFAKALHGDSIKVAYLGGSITAQNGWRVLSLEWLKQRFPKALFSEINAAIGAQVLILVYSGCTTMC